MRKPLLILAIVVARTANAHANAATEELSAGASVSAGTMPSLGWIANRIAGVWDATSRWQLRISLDATRVMAPGDEESNTIFNASASADLAIDSHWSVSLSAGGSPASTTHSSATILDETLPGERGEADAQLDARSAVMSLAASLEYDTAGSSDHETSGSISVGATHFRSIQAITSLIDPDGQPLTPQALGEHCTLQSCSDGLQSVFSPKDTQLTQLVLGASVLHTVEGAGDLGLSASYYLYDADPTQLGYYSLATLGRGNLGTGVSIAPLRYTVTPTIGDRWGPLSGTLAVTYGIYVRDVSYDLTTSLRVQYKLKLEGAARLKLYSKLAGSRGADPYGNTTTSMSLALGAQYSW
jgi:hypothetical protein